MKPKSLTLNPGALFFLLQSEIWNSIYFIRPLIVVCIFIPIGLYAREFKNISAERSISNHTSNTTGSPFTGTESLRANLYLVNDNNATVLADGVLAEYNDLFHDSVYLEDAYKFTNIKENLGLVRYGAVLAIERRPVISNADTLFLKLWKTSRRNYQFEFVTINLNHPGMQAFLEDAYLGISSELELNGKTKISFSINGDEASANTNRFRIVYKKAFVPAPLPMAFTSIKGYQLNGKVHLEWKVENDINIERYEIERSVHGFEFIKLASTIVSGLNNASSSYSIIDNNAVKGNSIYRVRSVDRDGVIKFSPIVKMTTGEAGAIRIYPNPIKNNIVNLEFVNQPTGTYIVRLINSRGQMVYSGKLFLDSGNISTTIRIYEKLALGIYQLEIRTPGNNIYVEKAMIQE